MIPWYLQRKKSKENSVNLQTALNLLYIANTKLTFSQMHQKIHFYPSPASWCIVW
jgi:hypothetical protein